MTGSNRDRILSNNICPIRMIGHHLPHGGCIGDKDADAEIFAHARCIGDTCQWFDEESGICAVMLIANKPWDGIGEGQTCEIGGGDDDDAD